MLSNVVQLAADRRGYDVDVAVIRKYIYHQSKLTKHQDDSCTVSGIVGEEVEFHYMYILCLYRIGLYGHALATIGWLSSCGVVSLSDHDDMLLYRVDYSDSSLVDNPTIRLSGFHLPRRQWSLLNHFQTGWATAACVERNGVSKTMKCVTAVTSR